MSVTPLKLKYVALSAIAQNDPELAELNFPGFLQLENNPKLHATEKIADSIERHGFRDPLAWDKNLNNGKGGIVEGNGRLEALILLKSRGAAVPRGILATAEGDWAIPILFGLDAQSEAAAIAYSLDHNSLVLPDGSTPQEVAKLYDLDAYLAQLNLLEEEGELPQSVPIDDYRQLLEGMIEPEEDPEEGEGKARKEKEAITVDVRDGLVLGSMWQLGRHRLYCGDCTDEAAIAKLLGSYEPGLIWGDPPYGISIQNKDGSMGRTDSKAAAAKYIQIAGDSAADIAIASAMLYLNKFPKPIQAWWGVNHYPSAFPPSPCWIVWDKDNLHTPFADAELAWTNQGSAVRIFKHTWHGFLTTGDQQGKPRIHPTQKPIELLTWFWDKYAPEVKFCLDPFLGSGSSIIAVEKHETRIVYGFELMPEYCELILQRWETETGESAELISDV